MIAIPKSLKTTVAVVLTVIAFIAALYAVAAIYHWMFGTIGGNL